MGGGDQADGAAQRPTLEPAEARSILKYLSTYHGLAPEEAKPVMYFPEHRIQDEVIPNETIRTTCNNCHALGKALSWRRSKEDWKLLTNMHVAFFPQADAAFRRMAALRGARAAGDGRARRRGGRHHATEAAERCRRAQPVDETIDFLGKSTGCTVPSGPTGARGCVRRGWRADG